MSASPSSPRSPSSPSYTTSEDSESVSFTLPPLSNTFSLSAQNKLNGDGPISSNSNLVTIAPGQVLQVRDSADGVPEIEIHPASVLVDDSPAVSVSSPSNTPTPTPNPVSPGLEATASPGSPELPGFKSPNVYINGLPPHYPEDRLFELARPFGTVRSVRSFTRHVGERESGYGFVLFETIEAAESCINELRKSRNLHPTFSKQIHKIPGAAYTPVLPSGVPLLPSDAAAWEYESASTASFPASSVSDNMSFKSRMEKLHDPNSTNLYIEGLPLTIDESSLAALVQPHRIRSFRFFQTRLSDPPRIIAFVRLETRKGAEEVIERLHGRMVRGWNDPGSRISVRFADTSEQRELRRSERSGHDGEQSPARLTIAQAALLNLRGRDNFTVTSQNALSNFPASTSASLSASPSQALYQTVPHRPIIGGSDFASNAANVGYQSGSLPRLPPIHAQNPHAATRFDSHSQINPTVTALFDAMRRDGVPFEPEPPFGDQAYLSQQFQPYVQRQLQPQATRNGSGVPIQLGHPGSTQARGGYTPTEEYILQAHAASVHAGTLPFQAKRRPLPTSRVDFGRAYAMQNGAPFDASSDLDYDVGLGLGVRAHRAQASTVSMPPIDGSAQAHVRSTTLPQQSQSYSQARHFPHNSLSSSIAPRQSQSSPHSNSHPTLDGLRTYSHPSSHLHQYSKHRSNPLYPSSNQVFGNSNNEQLSLQSSHLHSHSNKNHSHIKTSNHLNQHRLYTSSDINHSSAYTNDTGGTIELDTHTIDIRNLHLNSPKAVEGACVPSHHHPHHHHHHSKNMNIDIDIYKHRHRLEVDPPPVSPALTYGSGFGETPSSLSPVTPFMSEFREEFGVVDG